MSLEALLRAAVESGTHVIVIKVETDDSGEYSAAVNRPLRDRWTSARDVDPVAALRVALLEDERLMRDAPRALAAARDPGQLELEDAIAATGGDDFGDLGL